MNHEHGTRALVHRSSFIVHRFFFTLLLIIGCARREAPKPNVLLITLDTFRADRVGPLTPTLAHLAAHGVRFDSADAAVPLTLPSHATILSGLLPPHHGLRNNGGGTFPTDRDTLATVLSRHGWRTGAFVSSFVLDHRFGLNRGFDIYDDEVVRDPTNTSTSLEAERRGADTVDRALAWLKHADGRPWFAWVHLYDAHAPYAPPSPYPQSYDGEIVYVDAQVGRLLSAIDRDKTIVVVAGDHGEALGEHGELTHGLLLYEPTLHVPMIMVAASITPRLVREPVSTVDVAPTLASLAGVPLGGHIDGVDLAPALRSGGAPPASDLYAETEYPVQLGWSDLMAMRRGNIKVIRAPRPEVYDLGRDPGERVNAIENQRRVYRELVARLDALSATAIVPKAFGVDEETRLKLASLGYVAPVHATPANVSRANPEDMAPYFRQFEEAHTLLTAKHVDEALRIMEGLVRVDPNNAVFRASLAQAWRQRGNVQRAIELYREAVAQTPDDPEAWYNLAAALQDAGDHQKAGAAIREALRRDDKRPEAHNVLGIALASTGKFEEAKNEFHRAIAIDPRNARAFNNLGNTFRAMNLPVEAEQAYRKSVALAPRYADPLNGLGTLEVQRDHPREAIPLFDRAIALAPNYYEARLNRAIALQVSGDRASAAREYESLLRSVGNRPEYRAQREAATQLLGRLRKRP